MPVNDHTPASNPDAALYWAAAAVGLAERRAKQGKTLTADERVNYDRFQAAAHAHGFTDEEISDYLVNAIYPSQGTN